MGGVYCAVSLLKLAAYWLTLSHFRCLLDSYFPSQYKCVGIVFQSNHYFYFFKLIKLLHNLLILVLPEIQVPQVGNDCSNALQQNTLAPTLKSVLDFL